MIFLLNFAKFWIAYRFFISITLKESFSLSNISGAISNHNHKDDFDTDVDINSTEDLNFSRLLLECPQLNRIIVSDLLLDNVLHSSSLVYEIFKLGHKILFEDIWTLLFKSLLISHAHFNNSEQK